MSTRTFTVYSLHELRKLTPSERAALIADIEGMIPSEGFPTFEAAEREHAKRLGNDDGILKRYVACLR